MAVASAGLYEKMQAELERMFMGVGDDVLGPRVTGKPLDLSALTTATKPGTVIRMERPPGIPEFLQDHVTIDYEQSKMLGYTVHLALEGKAVFFPLSEILAETDLGNTDRRVLETNPQGFLRKFGKTMIVTARERLREGKLGTPEELEKYQSESWLTPEQIAVLGTLRAECV